MRRLRMGIENVAEARDRQPRLVEVLPYLGEAQYRLHDPAGQHVECDEFADAEVSFDHQPRTEVEGCGEDQLAHELNCLARDIAKIGDPKTCLHIAGELIFPAS